jgi:hypothetical protein
MTPGQLLLAALLNMFPHMSGNNRACIIRNFDSIAQVADSVERDLEVLLMEVVAL